MSKFSEKELYENEHCYGLDCRSCPFYNSTKGKNYEDRSPTVCYDAFTDYYEKKEVIDHVLKGEKE